MGAGGSLDLAVGDPADTGRPARPGGSAPRRRPPPADGVARRPAQVPVHLAVEAVGIAESPGEPPSARVHGHPLYDSTTSAGLRTQTRNFVSPSIFRYRQNTG